MTILDTNFTSDELNNFQTNFRKFIRLTSLSQDRLQQKWVSDEADFTEALKSVVDMFHSTSSMVGKRKHRGIDYNFIGEVKQDMTELLLTGDDEVKTGLRRKRYLPLYYLIVEPAINLMSKFDHITALTLVDRVMEELTNTLYTTEFYGTYDDALIAAAQVKQIVQQHEEQQKIERSKRKRKRKPIEIEIIEDPIEEE